MTYYRTLIKIAKNENENKTDHTKVSWTCGATGNLIHHWWECKIYNHFGKSWAVSYKVKHTHPPYNPEISFLGMHPGKIKMYIHTKSVCEYL